jgi:hypothetical protein
MHVSMKWLKELVDVDLPVEDLVDRLDMTGTAVEAVRTLGEELAGVVVGSVVAKEPHPDADKLSYCTVNVGGPSRCASSAARPTSRPATRCRSRASARLCPAASRSRRRSCAAR